jgi:virginiamycin B lyase
MKLMEATMKSSKGWLLAGASLVALLLQADLQVQAQSAAALSGKVTSAEEPVMEGVIVSAKMNGSTKTISVVTNEKGEYNFPATKLDPGKYTISIRAAGYDLDEAKTVDIAAAGGKPI